MHQVVLHWQVLYFSFSGPFPVYFSGSLPRSKIAEFKFWYRVYLEKIYSFSRRSSNRNPQTFWMEELLLISQDCWDMRRYSFFKSAKSQGGYHYWTNSTSDPNKTEFLVGRTIFYSYFYCSTVLRLDEDSFFFFLILFYF